MLRKRAEFVALNQSARRFVRPAFVVQMLPREGETDPAAIRIGFTATKKLGGAVVRNRVKRRLREAVRQMLPGLGLAGHDYVFIAREKAETCDYADMLKDMRFALDRLRRPETPRVRPPAEGA